MEEKNKNISATPQPNNAGSKQTVNAQPQNLQTPQAQPQQAQNLKQTPQAQPQSAGHRFFTGNPNATPKPQPQVQNQAQPNKPAPMPAKPPEKAPKKSWSKKTTAFVASLLIVVMLGCFGTTLWLILTKFRIVEITATSYICQLDKDKVETSAEEYSKKSAILSFYDEGKDRSVADISGVELKSGQCIKIDYDLKNMGPNKISLRFDLVDNTEREDDTVAESIGTNCEVSYVLDGERFNLIGSLILIDLKRGESKRVTIYITIGDLSHSGGCSIGISNSFYNIDEGGK